VRAERNLPRHRFTVRHVGPATIVALVVAWAGLWALLRPPYVLLSSYLGQLAGAQSILLLSIGLVLISTLPWVETWFDGIDRAAIWHRRVAICGVLLLIPHVIFSGGGGPGGGGGLGDLLAIGGIVGMVSLVVWAILPRWQSVVPGPLRGAIIAARDAPGVRHVRGLFGGYDRWRAVHRTTGLFVAAGFAHGVLDGTHWTGAPALRWVYVAIGAIGLGFYAYREVLARFIGSLHDYEVEAVAEVGAGLTEIAMKPLGRPVGFAPGQFAIVYIEAKDGWHRHPFTIASAPHEPLLRVTIKALGDYTTRVRELVEPGMPAVIGGPHGRFSHHRGTDCQLWIAGGVGVAPFLSWLRGLDGQLEDRVEFFYSNAGPLPFAAEIEQIAARHPSLHVHLVDTSAHGRLTSAQALAACDGRTERLSVFMCGPQAMLRTFHRGLRDAGIRPSRIHREYFDWR
jgi:predicted ferric reductase